MSIGTVSSSTGPYVITVSTFYNYTPTEGILIAACVVFGIETILLLVQFARSRRTYFLLWIPLFTASEAGGYIAFTLLVASPTLNAYLAELIILILAPNIVTLVDYTVVGKIVPHAGFDSASRWVRYGRWIPVGFVTSDLVALIVQGIGGSYLSNAHHDGVVDNTKLDIGRDLTLAGISAQLAFQSVFALLALQLYRSMPDVVLRSRLRLVWLSVLLTMVLVFARNIYRIVEFASGQYGAINNTEVPYMVLDLLLMAAVGAVFVLINLGADSVFPDEIRLGPSSSSGTAKSVQDEPSVVVVKAGIEMPSV